MVSDSENMQSVAQQINVEVAYARDDSQLILKLRVKPGTTLEQAVVQSGILKLYPEINTKINKMGVFGKLGKKTAELSEGDRVEIYRPLIADPKEVRRKREADGKKMKKGGGEK